MSQLEELTTVTQSEMSYDSNMRAALGITSSLVTVSILLSNLVLSGTILYNRELRRNQFSILVLMLCIISFIIGVVILPFSIDQEVKSGWEFGLMWCETWMILDVFLFTIAILYLATINIERLLLALRPDKYKNDMHITVRIFMIGLPWLLAALISLPLTLKSEPVMDSNGYCSVIKGKYRLATIVIFFLIPMVLVTLIIIGMVLAISRLSRQMYTIQVVSMARNDAIVLCVINLTFFALWVPFFIVSAVMSYGKPQEHEKEQLNLILQWTYWLGFLSLAILPWLWLLQKEIRNGYKKLLGCEV